MTEILGKFSRAGFSDCREIGSSGRFWAKTDPRGVFAAKNGHTDILRILDKGAKPNIPDGSKVKST